MGKVRQNNNANGIIEEPWKRVKGKRGGVVKVTYISRPVLVRTYHASQFRSLVHQLTGKESKSNLDDQNAMPILLDHHQQQHSSFFAPSSLFHSPPSSMNVS
ncbi:hypothetical protein HN51_014553 [Arachis hypogaea]|nr:uncharacterized protein DS421_6g179950 [Arachis hypogaea]